MASRVVLSAILMVMVSCAHKGAVAAVNRVVSNRQNNLFIVQRIVRSSTVPAWMQDIAVLHRLKLEIAVRELKYECLCAGGMEEIFCKVNGLTVVDTDVRSNRLDCFGDQHRVKGAGGNHFLFILAF